MGRANSTAILPDLTDWTILWRIFMPNCVNHAVVWLMHMYWVITDAEYTPKPDSGVTARHTYT